MSELSEKQEEILQHRNQRNIAGDELKGSYRDLKRLEETLSQLRSKEQGREQLLQLQAELERKKKPMMTT